MPQHIDIIRKAVIKAVPSIMELKFGCGVKYGDNQFPSYALYAGELSDGQVVLYLWNQREPIRVSKDQLESFGEILGRPITLADVLLAINKKLSSGRYRFSVDMGGQFISEMINWEEDEVYFWELKNDNLESQSKSTLLFLSELLKE